jgi:Rrf2 family iron-sulfur cluster assembly transcriptional regulator
MQVSASEEYGLRCLLRVYFHEGPTPITVGQIAAEEGLNPEQVAKLMRPLRSGNLVTAMRGPGGGYRPTRSANEVHVWDALRLLGDGVISDVFCDRYSPRRGECVHIGNCSIRSLWKQAQSMLRSLFEHVTLEDLRRDENPMSTWLNSPPIPPTIEIKG